MNKQETIQLLALIKLAYPEAYKDMDQASKQATVNMWATSFSDVPYPIMEQAFNHHRMTSKFAPKFSEMVDELKHIHYRATERALIQKTFENEDGVRHFKAIMDITYRFKDGANLGLNLGSIPNLLTGGEQYERLGTSGDYEMPSDRLSLMDESGRG